jgi:hypothetical protein
VLYDAPENNFAESGVCCHESIIKRLLPRLYYQDFAARTLLDSRVLMLYDATENNFAESGVCCHESIIKRLLPRLYYQDSAARTLLSGLCCKEYFGTSLLSVYSSVLSTYRSNVEESKLHCVIMAGKLSNFSQMSNCFVRANEVFRRAFPGLLSKFEWNILVPIFVLVLVAQFLYGLPVSRLQIVQGRAHNDADVKTGTENSSNDTTDVATYQSNFSCRRHWEHRWKRCDFLQSPDKVWAWRCIPRPTSKSLSGDAPPRTLHQGATTRLRSSPRQSRRASFPIVIPVPRSLCWH